MSSTDRPDGPAAAQRWVLLVCLSAALLAVLFLVQTNSRTSILIKEASYIAGGLAVALAVLVLGLTGKLRAAPRLGPAQLIPLAAVLLLGPVHMLAGSGSVNAPFNSASLLALSIIAAALALFADRWVRDRLALVLLAAGGLVCVYALLQWGEVGVFPWDRALAKSGRVSGSLGNPNLMGSLAAVLPMPAIGYMLYRKLPGAILLPASIGVVCLSGLAIVASGTRGSLIGLGAGFLVLLALQARRIGRRTMLVIVLLLLLGILVVYVPMHGRFEELAGGDGGTLTVRRVIWSGALRAFLDRPVTGWGPGSFQKVFPAYRNPAYHLMGVSHNTLHAHCEYLELLLDSGLVGALLWAGLAAAVVLRRRRMGPMDALGAGIAAAVLGLLAEGLVSVALRWAPSAMLLALLAGMMMIGGREVAERWRRVARPTALPAVVPAVLLALSLPLYTGAMKAGRLLFGGKNVHLSRAEPAMDQANSMAARWAASGDRSLGSRALDRWRVGRMAADSAVFYCQRCVEAHPSDLGGWYALGSSYLTRAIVAAPNSKPMSSLLRLEGGLDIDTALELDMTRRALDAYRRLRELAPDYAEVHNNMALVHTRLDNLDSAMVYMHRAYELHAHRRLDYYLQICDLGPLLESDWAWRTYLFHSVPHVDAGGGREQSALEGVILNTVAFMLQRYPDRADSMVRMAAEVYDEQGLRILEGDRYAVLIEMARMDRLALRADSLLLAGDTAAARSILDTIPPDYGFPGMALPVVRARAGLSREPVSALFLHLRLLVRYYGVHLGRTRMGLRPFEDLISASAARAGQPGWWGPMREGSVLMLYADREFSGLCELAESEFPESTRDSVAALLERRWRALGGPRYCAARGADGAPWTEDGILYGLAAALDGIVSAADSSGPAVEEGHLARVELAYMLLSTQMWSSPYLSQVQVDSLISWAAPSVSWLADSLGGERYADRIGRRFMLVDEELANLVQVANGSGMEALCGWFSDAETARHGAPDIHP